MRIQFGILVFSVSLALGIAGCSKQATDQSSEPAAPAALTVAIDPTTVGSVTGIVKLEGTPPKFAAIIMTAEPPCVKANPTPVVPPVVVTGEHGELANAVVYVKSGLQNYKYDTPPPPAVLDQKNCMYAPRVVAMMSTQSLQIGNEDPTSHNVHPEPKINRPWNRSIPPGSTPLEVNFQKPELAIPVVCNIHAWMRAYLFVFAHPYYAITTKTGEFELKNLPPGTYTIEAWQERYGTQDQTVTIGPKESKAVSFTFMAAPPK